MDELGKSSFQQNMPPRLLDPSLHLLYEAVSKMVPAWYLQLLKAIRQHHHKLMRHVYQQATPGKKKKKPQ